MLDTKVPQLTHTHTQAIWVLDLILSWFCTRKIWQIRKVRLI